MIINIKISNTNRKVKQNSNIREVKKIVKQEKIENERTQWKGKNKGMNKQKRNKIK